MAEKFKIKKGDKVIVVTGRDKGKQGEDIDEAAADEMAESLFIDTESGDDVISGLRGSSMTKVEIKF